MFVKNNLILQCRKYYYYNGHTNEYTTYCMYKKMYVKKVAIIYVWYLSQKLYMSGLLNKHTYTNCFKYPIQEIKLQ